MGEAMPRVRLTKSSIDSLPVTNTDLVYWDAGLPGFGVKVTPAVRQSDPGHGAGSGPEDLRSAAGWARSRRGETGVTPPAGSRSNQRSCGSVHPAACAPT